MRVLLRRTSTIGDGVKRKLLWKIVGAGTGIAAASLARSALTAGWRRTRDEDPPGNPASPSTRWPEALGWAVLTGVAIGVARLVATRGAPAGWRKATGSLPPGVEDPVCG